MLYLLPATVVLRIGNYITDVQCSGFVHTHHTPRIMILLGWKCYFAPVQVHTVFFSLFNSWVKTLWGWRCYLPLVLTCKLWPSKCLLFSFHSPAQAPNHWVCSWWRTPYPGQCDWNRVHSDFLWFNYWNLSQLLRNVTYREHFKVFHSFIVPLSKQPTCSWSAKDAGKIPVWLQLSAVILVQLNQYDYSRLQWY